MVEEQLIENVKNSINGLDLHKTDDLVVYLNARDLLIDNGFIKNKNLKLQNAYKELFSEEELLDKGLDKTLRDIKSKDRQLCLVASQILSREPFNEVNLITKFYLRNPLTIDLLLNVLNDQEDEDIFVNIAVCLGRNALRYKYDDISVFDNIFRSYDNLKKTESKMWVVGACAHFPTDKKWRYICEVLYLKPEKDAIKRISLPLGMYAKEIPNKYRDKIIDRLIEVAKNVRGKYVKADAVRSLLDLSKRSDIEKLLDIRNSVTLLPSVVKDLDTAIKNLSNN
ncbi:MAG: hypothetical protein ACK5MJ_00805 [Alphaproteobacteria bacterium]